MGLAPSPFRPRRRPLDSLALSLAAVLCSTVSWHTPSDWMREALKLVTLQTPLGQLADDLRMAAGGSAGSGQGSAGALPVKSTSEAIGISPAIHGWIRFPGIRPCPLPVPVIMARE